MSDVLRAELRSRLGRGKSLRERLEVTPQQYVYVAWFAVVLLAVIVMTGAAVRLTDSGLGCPTWPRCYGHVYPPDQTHALIEFGNRVASTLVGIAVALVAILSLTRRPFRRDLAFLAWLLPLGVIAQAVLGGYTVRYDLAPGFVMGHFGLSMIILIAAVALLWRSTYENGSRPRRNGALVVWMTRVTVALGGLTIFAGTVATGAGPHSGGIKGQDVHRLTFKGGKTLEWAVNQHATIGVIFGIAVIATWVVKMRKRGSVDMFDPLTILGVTLAGQGLLGEVQYELKLPAGMVWLHVGLATLLWLLALWAWADAGRPARRQQPLGGAPPPVPATRELEVV
ncbi:MAG TPA: COX15/CtaA family protein [Solirubrobacteraceae bacterium]|nr:COX15/CtaA family protein [Solirubrobacteraceae bacterium]